MEIRGVEIHRMNVKGEGPDRGGSTTKWGRRGNVFVEKRIVAHQFEYLPKTSPDSTSNNLAETTIDLGTSLSLVLVG